MKRIYHPYWLWEDYQAGMYDLTTEYSEQEEMMMALKVKDLLSNQTLFLEQGKRVINEWKIACEVNLSNSSRNKQAFFGQAVCCYVYGIPERITKLGWRMIDPETQKAANQTADKLTQMWELKQNAQTLLN
jgi:hypothetical protein